MFSVKSQKKNLIKYMLHSQNLCSQVKYKEEFNKACVTLTKYIFTGKSKKKNLVYQKLESLSTYMNRIVADKVVVIPDEITTIRH